MTQNLELSIGVNRLARWMGVSGASILTWSRELPELFRRASDGGFCMHDGLATFVSLAKPLLKARNRWSQIKDLWRSVDRGIAMGLATNGRAFLIGERARGRLYVVVLPSGTEPVPVAETEVVNLSELASRWGSEIQRECASRRGRPRRSPDPVSAPAESEREVVA